MANLARLSTFKHNSSNDNHNSKSKHKEQTREKEKKSNQSFPRFNYTNIILIQYYGIKERKHEEKGRKMKKMVFGFGGARLASQMG